MKRFEFSIFFGGRAFVYFDENGLFRSATVVYEDYSTEVTRRGITGRAYLKYATELANEYTNHQISVFKEIISAIRTQSKDEEMYHELIDCLSQDKEIYGIIGHSK